MCCIQSYFTAYVCKYQRDPWIVVESVFGKLDKTEKERCFVFYIRLITRFPLAT